MIELKQYVVSIMGTNSFLLMDKDTKALALVDPGEFSEEILKDIHSLGDDLQMILLTHGHFDHIGGVASFLRLFPNAKVYVGEKDVECINDDKLNLSAKMGRTVVEKFPTIPLKDNEEISLGNTKIKFIETPGHTRDCISFYCEKEKLILASETTGYPLLPDKVVPTYLVGYAMTIDSIRRLQMLHAEKMLVSHLGVVDRDFIEEFLPKSEIGATKARDMVLDGYARGLDTVALMAMFKNEFYNGDIIRLQPEKAFDLNAYYTVTVIIREYEKKNINGGRHGGNNN